MIQKPYKGKPEGSLTLLTLLGNEENRATEQRHVSTHTHTCVSGDYCSFCDNIQHRSKYLNIAEGRSQRQAQSTTNSTQAQVQQACSIQMLLRGEWISIGLRQKKGFSGCADSETNTNTSSTVGSYIACPKTKSINYNSADNSMAHSRLDKKVENATYGYHTYIIQILSSPTCKNISKQSLLEVRIIY